MTEDGPELRTARLLLRRWRDDDRAAFAAMNEDPAVMEHFPAPMTAEQTDAFLQRVEQLFVERRFGLWAIEVLDTGQFVGFAGLLAPRFEAHFTPAVEIGWRLARTAWGHGYATEAARAALEYGFTTLGLDEIVSFTTTTNLRSQAVMRRLGMRHDPADDFDHPLLPDWPQRRHVLYRLSAERWRAAARYRPRAVKR